VRRFLSWCEAEGNPPVLDKPTVTAYIADSLEACEATTAGGRLLALKRLSAWAAEEGEQDVDRIASLRPPKLDRKLIQPLSDDELRALLKTCDTKEFGDRRDEAITRFMIETAARANEVIGLELRDVDLPTGIATIRRGKAGTTHHLYWPRRGVGR
jgi:integrase/recombinase XerD